MWFYSYKKQISSLVIVSLLAINAHGDSDSEVIKSVFVDTLKGAEILGINDIDGKTTASLIKNANDLNVIVLPEIDYENHDSKGTHRNSGYWIKDAKAVILSYRHLSQMRDGIDGNSARGLIMHEFFGPLGVDDNNFSKSAMINTLIMLVTAHGNNVKQGKPAIVHSIDAIQEMDKHIQMTKGGTSGVGGGGDGRIHSYMCLVYQDLFHRLDLKKITSEQFHHAADKLDRLEVQFDNSIPQGAYNYDEKSSKLFVPADSTTEENFNKNFDAVGALVTELIK